MSESSRGLFGVGLCRRHRILDRSVGLLKFSAPIVVVGIADDAHASYNESIYPRYRYTDLDTLDGIENYSHLDVNIL